MLPQPRLAAVGGPSGRLAEGRRPFGSAGRLRVGSRRSAALRVGPRPSCRLAAFKGLVLLLLLFFWYFLGFAIDRSKTYIKVIKNHTKIDAVDP